jgi:hypothetical protein
VNDHLKLKLVDLVEKPVIASLIAYGYVECSPPNILEWDNIILKDITVELLKHKESKLEKYEELIETLMSIWPPEFYGASKNGLVKRLNQYKNKTPLKNIENDEIIVACEQWINQSEVPYCGQLFYFFFKEDNRIYKSRLDSLIEEQRGRN